VRSGAGIFRICGESIEIDRRCAFPKRGQRENAQPASAYCTRGSRPPTVDAADVPIRTNEEPVSVRAFLTTGTGEGGASQRALNGGKVPAWEIAKVESDSIDVRLAIGRGRAWRIRTNRRFPTPRE